MPLKRKGGQFTDESKRERARQRELSLMYQMREPRPLSPRAEWMSLQVPGCGAREWWNLFDDDKELWPFIIELAKEEYA